MVIEQYDADVEPLSATECRNCDRLPPGSISPPTTALRTPDEEQLLLLLKPIRTDEWPKPPVLKTRFDWVWIDCWYLRVSVYDTDTGEVVRVEWLEVEAD